MSFHSVNGYDSSKRWFTLIVILLLIGYSVYFIYQKIIPYAILSWDESSDILWIYKIFIAIKHADIKSFLSISKDQYLYYPPLESWIYAFPLQIFSFTIENARRVSLFWFAIGGGLIYVLGTVISRARSASRVGIIALTFYVLSPMTLIFSGLAIKEVLGSALSVLFVYLYFVSRDSSSRMWAAVCGIVLVINAYTKYPYALFLTTGFAIETLIVFRNKKSSHILKEIHIYILSFVVAAALFWIAIQGPRAFGVFGVQGPELNKYIGTVWQKIFFYPRSIVYFYALHPILGVFYLVSILINFLKMRDYKIRFMEILIITNMLIVGLWTAHLQDRFLFTTVPFIYLLSACTVNRVLIYVEDRLKLHLAMSVAIGLLCVSIVPLILSSRSFLRLAYATGSVTMHYPLFNQLDYKDLWFVYDKNKWPQKISQESKEWPIDVVQYVLTMTNYSPDITYVGLDLEFSPKYFALMTALEEDKRTVHPDGKPYIVMLEVLPNARYLTQDYRLTHTHIKADIHSVVANTSNILYAKKIFPEMGVIISIYKKAFSAKFAG